MGDKFMRTAVILGATTVALVSGGMLWQAQPSKRVLMTDDHPVVVDLQLPPDASALTTDGAPVGTQFNVTEAPLGKPLSFTGTANLARSRSRRAGRSLRKIASLWLPTRRAWIRAARSRLTSSAACAFSIVSRLASATSQSTASSTIADD